MAGPEMLGIGVSPVALALRPLRRDPVIMLASGSGLAGSVYASTIAGQWFADDVPIIGASATEWTMTAALEGAAIRCGSSNVIEMWVPGDLPAASRSNGGWWRAATQEVSAGRVSRWPDGFGQRDLVQTVVANQPEAGALGGRAAAVWPSAGNDCHLAPAQAFAPAWWLIVMAFRDGTPTLWPNSGGASPGFYGLLSNGAISPVLTRVVTGAAGTAGLYDADPAYRWTAEARRNAGAFSATLLPLPLTMLEFRGTPVSAAWALGRGSGQHEQMNRGWQGPILLAIACGIEPTADPLARLQGYAAHACGIAGSLPTDHPYRAAAPRRT